MIKRWKTFQRKSPFSAGIFAGAVSALVLIFLAALIFGAKGNFGSAKSILKEDYLRLSIGEFGQSGDIARARWRFERFGNEGSRYLYLLRNDPLTDPTQLLNYARSVGDNSLVVDNPTVRQPIRNGFPLLGIVFAVLMLILIIGFGALFLTDPKSHSMIEPFRLKLTAIFSRFTPKEKRTEPDRAESSEAQIRYRKPSFELHDGPPAWEADSARTSAISADADDRLEADSDPAASIFDVFDPTNTSQANADPVKPSPQSPSVDFFASVKSQKKKPADPAVAENAFSDRDLPTFLGESRTADEAAPILAETDAEAEPKGEPEFEPEFEPESEPAESLNADDDADDIEPESSESPEQSFDHSASAVQGSYAFYEPPRQRGRSQTQAGGKTVDEPVAADEELTLTGEDGDDDITETSPAGESVSESSESDSELDALAVDIDADETAADDELPPWDAPSPLTATEPQPAAAQPTAFDRVEPFRAESIYADATTDSAKTRDQDSDETPVEHGPIDERPIDEAEAAPAASTVRFSVEPPRVRNVTYNDENLPLIHYKAIYQLGDDLFDETFSIDDYDDEFIGECGIGIAETINTTEPKAVTAFEAWLFDRQDTTTPTFFMLSEYAYQQPEMLERLKNKGQYDVIKVGQSYIIETFALKMTLTVLEIVYGTESSDPRSYFDRVVFDVEVVRRSS